MKGNDGTAKSYDVGKLESGSAEVFGAELHTGQQVRLTGQKVAVFTWTGCRVTVNGSPSVIYLAEETPMVSYLNLSHHLDERRQGAKAAGGQGPRVVVLGPMDSGKSTLVRMLANWAARKGWQPMVVDVDVGQGSLTVPGCVAATPIEQPIDVEEGYQLEAPLVYFFGHASPGDNPDYYRYLIDRLSSILDRRCELDPAAGSSGMIINTFGWVDGPGYELQRHVIQAFKADVIIVMEQDRLFSQLSADLKGSSPPVTLLKLTKSGGVVKREKEERRQARDSRIKEYFYGHNDKLKPNTDNARTEQLVVYRVGHSGSRAPNSALPMGASSSADPLRITHVPVNAELVQSLMAVSHAGTPDGIVSMNVAGFILVKDVDSARGIVTYVSPCSGSVPGRYLLTGSLRSAID
ncbi:MAG: hypothetical protein WDW36_005793 [Sanguina aurantia]